MNEQPDLSPPPLPSEDPLASILEMDGPRLSEMTDEQLQQWVMKVRSARESPQITRALLTAKKKGSSAKAATKPNLDLLGL